MRIVQILGTASNLSNCRDLSEFGEAERWCSNSPHVYEVKWPESLDTWTRWINLHSKRHMLKTYPTWYKWYGEQTKPIYLQESQPDVPSSQAFPAIDIIKHFGHAYFTFSGSWFLAWAIMEGFDWIDLPGFHMQRNWQHSYQRPCFFYWVELARQRGIKVTYPDEVGQPDPPGDPTTYSGPIYGYQTTLPHFSLEGLPHVISHESLLASS